MKPYLAPTLCLILAACQTTTLKAPDLPSGYRAKAAIELAHEYARDAVSPAEINAEPKKIEAVYGLMSYVRVRYQVRQSILGSERLAMRCIMVSINRNPREPDKITFSAGRPRQDPSECQPDETFVAYTELEQMGAKVRACRERGDDRCLLATNMPEAEARKLINRSR
jgi:hypothetical protein